MSFRKELPPLKLWAERMTQDVGAYVQMRSMQKSPNEQRILSQALQTEALSMGVGFRRALWKALPSMRKVVAFSALSLLLMLPAYTQVLGGGTPPGSPQRGSVGVAGDEENTPPRVPHRRKSSGETLVKPPHADSSVVGVRAKDTRHRTGSGSPGKRKLAPLDPRLLEARALREKNHGAPGLEDALERERHEMRREERPVRKVDRKRVSRSHSGSPEGSPGGEPDRVDADERLADALNLESLRGLAAVRDEVLGREEEIRQRTRELESLRRTDRTGWDADYDEARSHMSARSAWTLQSRTSVAADFEVLLREKDGLLGEYQDKLRHGLAKYKEEQKQRRAAEKEARALKRQLEALKAADEQTRAETLKLVAHTLDRAHGKRDHASERPVAGAAVPDARAERETADFAGVPTHMLLSRVGDLQSQMEEYFRLQVQHQIMTLQQSYLRELDLTSLGDKVGEIYRLLAQVRQENGLMGGKATRAQLLTQADEALQAMDGKIRTTQISVASLAPQIAALEAQIRQEPRALTSAKERLKPGEHLSTV